MRMALGCRFEEVHVVTDRRQSGKKAIPLTAVEFGAYRGASPKAR